MNRMRRGLAIAVALCAVTAAAAEYRAYWVDTFHTPLGTHADIDRLIDVAVRSNANALFVEVRRRGDSWYLDSLEPLTEVPGVGEPDAGGRWTFDPLRYLIERAHAHGIQVHAFVIVGAIFRGDPTAGELPRDPNHVFLQHVWDAEHKRPYEGPRQWATRSSSGKYRYGDDWYIDLGHPDAAAYTINVLLHLVRAYDLDGIHLDRTRYPEAPGGDVGYNEVSVARFKARYGAEPRANDPRWSQWRRDQVTQFVRRLYLGVRAIKPSMIVSAALVAWSGGPKTARGFRQTDAYRRVFQDWSGWLDEGIIDMAVPMLYKREHVARERAQFDQWLSFVTEKAHANGRLAIAGIGAYMNGIEGTLRQGRRARKSGADGILMFAVGDTAPWSTTDNSTNTAVRRNPFAYAAPGRTTPKRPNEDFAAAVSSGVSATGTVRFEDRHHEPLFARVEPPPPRPPLTTGSIMGFARDGESPTLESLGDHQRLVASADGNGFFAFVKLPPGQYRLNESCVVQVEADRVVRIDP